MQESLQVLLSFVMLLHCGIGLLLPRSCFTQGNPWKSAAHINRRARVVSMLGENVGHSPFNTFPLMETFGNCIEVYFHKGHETINITIVCRPPSVAYEQNYQCPQYDPSVRWMLRNLIYLQYDAHRFELSSCVEFNETHSYHGQLLLADKIEMRMSPDLDHLPMWKMKLDEPGAMSFGYNANCRNCFFRNEYVAHMPYHGDLIFDSIKAEPYCVGGKYVPKLADPVQQPTGDVTKLHRVLLTLALAFFVVGLLLRYFLCSTNSPANVVVPVLPSEVKTSRPSAAT